MDPLASSVLGEFMKYFFPWVAILIVAPFVWGVKSGYLSGYPTTDVLGGIIGGFITVVTTAVLTGVSFFLAVWTSVRVGEK